MKIGFVTDLHITQIAGWVPEFQLAGLDWVVEQFSAADVDLICIGGDMSGHVVPYRSHPRERTAHAKFRQALAKIAPVVEIIGNHDNPADAEILSRLDYARAYTLALEPCVKHIVSKAGTVVVAMLPWVHAPNAETHGHHAAFLAAVERINAEAERVSGPHGVRILLGHAAISTAAVHAGQPATPTKDPLLKPEELMPWSGRGRTRTPLYDAAFFGHYHDCQPVDSEATSGAYGGSLFTSSFGETIDKGILIAEVNRGKATDYELINCPFQSYKLTAILADDGCSVNLLGMDVPVGNLRDELELAVADSNAECEFTIRYDIPKTSSDFSGIARALRASTPKGVKPLFRFVDAGRAKSAKRAAAAGGIAKQKTVSDKIAYYIDNCITPVPAANDRRRAIEIYNEIAATL